MLVLNTCGAKSASVVRSPAIVFDRMLDIRAAEQALCVRRYHRCWTSDP